MQTDPEETLSSFAVESIRALLATGPKEAPSSVDDRALLRFACGQSPRDEQDTLTKALTKSSKLRLDLIRTRRELSEVRAVPWSQALAKWVDSPVVEFLREAFNNTVNVSRIQSRALHSAASESLPEIGDWIRSTANPYRLSVVRGPRAESGSPGRLEIEASPDGDLLATFDIGNAPDLAGQELILEVIDAGGSAIEIGKAQANDESWQVRLPGAASQLGLEPGPVPAEAFRVRKTDGVGLRSVIWLPVVGPTTDWASFFVEDSTRVVDQTLILTLDPTPDTVVRYRDAVLEAILPTDAGDLLLGTWPIQELLNATEVSAQVPGLVFDGPVPPMVVRLHLRP